MKSLSYALALLFISMTLFFVSASRASIIWDESVNDDFSNNEGSPTDLFALTSGSNRIVGSIGAWWSSDSEDVAMFTVPAGYVLSQVILETYQDGVYYDYVPFSLHSGASTSDPTIEFILLAEFGAGTDLLQFDSKPGPQCPGIYAFKFDSIQQDVVVDERSLYSVNFSIIPDIDNDGDGYSKCQGDCDDNDNTVFPGATEIICDGKDSDCDPLTDNCNTPTGTNVSIQNGTGEAQITFSDVTGQGYTAITVEECEEEPEGITLDPFYPICVEITTDATFEGEAQVCISYDDTGLTPAQENSLTMVHCDDLTGICELLPCDPPVPVDTIHNVVCGCTDSFSTFVVGIPIDTDGDLIPDLSDNCPDFYDKTNQCEGIQMSLPANWSMISLPVELENSTPSILFPEAIVIYGYQKGFGYVRIEGNDNLEPGKGYWILLPEARMYSFIGKTIEEYTMAAEDGWFMIGGCTFTAKATLNIGEIVLIYNYVQGTGYQTVSDFSSIDPNKGYWILFRNTNEQSEFRVYTQL